MLKDIIKGLEPSSTLKINEISRQLEEKGEKIFKFGFGQSPFQIPSSIVDELKNNSCVCVAKPPCFLYTVLNKDISGFSPFVPIFKCLSCSPRIDNCNKAPPIII